MNCTNCNTLTGNQDGFCSDTCRIYQLNKNFEDEKTKTYKNSKFTFLTTMTILLIIAITGIFGSLTDWNQNDFDNEVNDALKYLNDRMDDNFDQINRNQDKDRKLMEKLCEGISGCEWVREKDTI